MANREEGGRRRKRGQNEGGLYQRADGVWVASVSLGMQNGKRKRRVAYGRTKTEAKERLQQLLAELKTTGSLPDPARLTVGEYLDQWAASAASTVRASTMESYLRPIRVHIKPALGDFPLAKLQPLQIQGLYTSMLQAGYSRRTVQYVHAVLRRALRQAVKLRLIPVAPTEAVDAPKPERRRMTVLSIDQLETLTTVLADDPLGPLYYLAIATGARRGELCALRWEDVDWETPAITINRAAALVEKALRFEGPKSDHSRRTIPLPSDAVAVLKRHRIAQAEQRLRLGALYQDHGLMFTRPDGRPLSLSHVTQHFGVVLRRAGLPHVRLHDLRHTHATMLLAAGVHPRIAAERLGDTVDVTMTTYSHVLPSMQQEVTRKLEQLLPPMPPAKRT